MEIESQLFQRADELMRDAPGRVRVRRISDIDEVRLLRSAEASLTQPQREELARLRLDLMERLDGIVDASTSTHGKESVGWFQKFRARWRTATTGVADVTQVRPDFEELARETTALRRLPPPPELLAAAEAWVISHLVADQVEADLSGLRTSWEDARVESPE